MEDPRCGPIRNGVREGLPGSLSAVFPMDHKKMTKRRNIPSVIFLSCLVAMFLLHDASSDLIVLKDGTREESNRVWESEAYVHFILKGTKTVEVRFAKEFVDHIERAPENKEQPSVPEEPATGVVSADLPVRNAPNQQKSEVEKEKKEFSPAVFEKKIVEENKGVSFYDPRRPKRYWANKNAGYKTLEEALSDLARAYGRSVEWVRQNMGEENDLGLIHASLIRQLERESQSRDRSASITDLKASQNSGPDVSRKKDLPKSNQNQKHPREISFSDITHYGSSDGFHFYDPRRAKKYWISPSEGFDTLDEALAALARTYHVSVDWVEEHMGESNLIEDIHQNIRHNLVSE